MRRAAFIAFLMSCFICFSAGVSLADYIRFTDEAGNPISFIQIRMLAPDLGYALGGDLSVYRSLDGGSSWSRTGRPYDPAETSTSATHYACFHPDGIWLSVNEAGGDAAGRSFLYHSIDGGLSFTDLGPGIDAQLFAASSALKGRVARVNGWQTTFLTIGTDYGVLARSSDGWVNWVRSDLSVTGGQALAANNGLYLVAETDPPQTGHRLIQVNQTGGLTDLAPFLPTGLVINHVYLAPVSGAVTLVQCDDDPASIVGRQAAVSHDGGSTFGLIYSQPAGGDEYGKLDRALAVGPADALVSMTEYSGPTPVKSRIRRSSDNGLTWTTIVDPGRYEGLYEFQVDYQGGVYAMVMQNGVYQGLIILDPASGAEPIRLSNGLPMTAAPPEGGQARYIITVPENAAQLTATLSDLTVDMDMYVQVGRPASQVDYLGKSTGAGTGDEVCLFTDPMAGDWHILVTAADSGRGVLTASYRIKGDETETAELVNGQAVAIDLGLDERRNFKITVPENKNLTVTLTSISGEAASYVKFNAPASQTDYDCYADRRTGGECSFTPASLGDYYIMVQGVSASRISLKATYSDAGQDDDDGGGDDGDDGDDGLPVIDIGQDFYEFSVDQGETKHFRYQLSQPAARLHLMVHLGQLEGSDIEFYVRRGAKAGRGNYDCTDGPHQSAYECTMSNAASGDWYIMVYGLADSHGWTSVWTE